MLNFETVSAHLNIIRSDSNFHFLILDPIEIIIRLTLIKIQKFENRWRLNIYTLIKFSEIFYLLKI